jgi:hypothetical protein
MASKYSVDENYRRTDTPMDQNIYGILYTATKLEAEGKLKEVNSNIHFPSIVAELCRFARVFRPDILFPATLLSRFTHKHNITHVRLAIRIVKYLYTTKELVWRDRKRTIKPGQKHVIEVWYDSDFAGDKVERKSVTGIVVELDGHVIANVSKQQTGITTSTGHAETSAGFLGSKIANMLYNVMSQHMEIELPIPLYGDNNTATNFILNEDLSKKTKHWDIALKYSNQLYQLGIIMGIRVDSDDNKSDIHTKALGRLAFERHRLALGIR